MRHTLVMLTLILFGSAFTAVSAAGQDVGDAITLVGCLVHSEDGEEMEFSLENVEGDTAGGHEIELTAGEGVNFTPHVGHTVEITGVIMTDDEDEHEGDDEDEDEHEDQDEDELHIRVDNLGHKAASCSAP